ncbi:hydrolytic protein [Streptomyces sp. NPDC059875]|uniref:COG1470 family protein n=1 Tax=unclassified Streptomyces TaxID=2593676 RepID=UPI00364A58C2
MPTVTVSPGGEATTTLNVRNDSDIVEAYTLTVVGDCAAWSTVEPARVSLYPGTSETVTVRLAPPRSPEVRAGEKPLGVRVLPVEHPENVVVPETTVHVEAFHEVRRELTPRRRRGWLGARYRIALRNQGNTPVSLALASRQAGEELTLRTTPQRQRLEPGESAEIALKARVRSLIWFGEPASRPFEIEVADAAETDGADGSDGDSLKSDREPPAAQPAHPVGSGVVEGEFVQLPILPKWLLILLAVLMALLIAWFALVRPAVRSAAKEAATAAQKEEAAKQEKAKEDSKGQAKPSTKPGGQEEGSGGQGDGGTDTGPAGTGRGQQSSATIDVQTGAGGKKLGTYQVPQGKVFGITDIVVANFQGDEGVITISFGERKITTIALETFRNQDYHWVTPIDIPENSTVTAEVSCAKPGTPATGKQASGCHEVLNVSGVLRDLRP